LATHYAFRATHYLLRAMLLLLEQNESILLENCKNTAQAVGWQYHIEPFIWRRVKTVKAAPGNSVKRRALSKLKRVKSVV
jgi:hypothetical protein